METYYAKLNFEQCYTALTFKMLNEIQGNSSDSWPSESPTATVNEVFPIKRYMKIEIYLKM